MEPQCPLKSENQSFVQEMTHYDCITSLLRYSPHAGYSQCQGNSSYHTTFIGSQWPARHSTRLSCHGWACPVWRSDTISAFLPYSDEGRKVTVPGRPQACRVPGCDSGLYAYIWFMWCPPLATQQPAPPTNRAGMGLAGDRPFRGAWERLHCYIGLQNCQRNPPTGLHGHDICI